MIERVDRSFRAKQQDMKRCAEIPIPPHLTMRSAVFRQDRRASGNTFPLLTGGGFFVFDSGKVRGWRLDYSGESTT